VGEPFGTGSNANQTPAGAIDSARRHTHSMAGKRLARSHGRCDLVTDEQFRVFVCSLAYEQFSLRTMHPTKQSCIMKRRQYLQWMGSAAALGCLNTSVVKPALCSPFQAPKIAPLSRVGTADSCIFLWLGGGACQIDTFDPKRLSTGRKDPGSAYAAIDTAIPGVQLCQHLSRTAKLLDRCAEVRSLHHNVVD